MKSKLCLIYNTAPLYREAIFKAIDAEYDCDWFFGVTKSDIKEMDLSKLKNVTIYRTFGNPNKCYWKVGVLKLLFQKRYQNFFMLAETRSITDWIFFWMMFTFFKKKRVYIWTHGYYGKERKIEEKLKLWLYRNVAGTFVYGNYAKDLLLQKGISNEKLFVIHNSLQYDRQVELRNKIKASDIYTAHFKNKRPTIIFIGRLTKVKRLDMLIDAVFSLKEHCEYYNLVFVGDGEERESLGQLVLDRKLQNEIWFYGACYEEKINAELIYNADLCVAPGNVGLTAMHTMVFGTPVISHNKFEWQMPEFEAIRPGETGDFFEYDNIDSLVSVISNWFKKNENRREVVRNACYNEIDTQWNPQYQMKIISENLKLV